VVTGFPVQPLEVQLGDGEAYAAVRDALKQSLLVAEHAEGAKYRVLARNGAYWITLPGSERPLTSELDIAEPANVDKLVKRLEAMARWRNIKDLGNPTSQIAGQIKMQVLGEDGKLLESSVRLSQLKAAAGEPILPAIRVRLTNQSNKKLFCTLLCLSESFAVDALVEGNNKVQPLEAGETVELNRGEPMLFELPDELWKLGITERTDVLKLVVSSEDFDANLLEQAKLDFPTRSGATRGLDEGNPLQQLMRRVATRDPVKKSDKYADWCTQTFALTIVRPPENAIISPSQPAEVGVEGARIRVKPHPQLKAKVGMATKAQAIRSVEGLNVPPILRDNPGLVQPLQFSTTRGSGGALEVFELTDIANPESVTPEHPLELELPISFDPSTEQIIPLAIHKDEHGTEYYLPLGFAEPAATRAVGDGTTVKLEYLPNLPEVSTEERTRSLFNSLRMMFLKVVGDKFGIKVANQTLSAVEVSAEGTAKYVKDPAEVKRRVEALQAGQKVLLYVHGILGETKDIVGTVVSTPSGLTQPISQHYPLILAYDYENLNTSIKESGRLLREKLIEVGLGPNHGKNLNIVAHSMGGLVARWFIEHQGGGSDQMVKRLVMLGTPNGGSPWLNLKDWVTHMLTLAVNGLAPAAWVATILNGAVLLLRATTTTSEMKLNSPFIQELGSNLAEGVKYAFIAGDASLQGGKERQGFVGQLLNLTLHGASKQLFQGKPNDLAASVDSVLSPVSGERPAPIPSDHFSYFVPEVGLGSLVKELEG
jgi:pimeloyl-ACP methyl ester carboxylesterase